MLMFHRGRREPPVAEHIRDETASLTAMIAPRITSALLVAGALGLTTVVSSPSLRGFALEGASLGVATVGNGYQRDVRIFNNAADPSANDNVAPNVSFPGALGATMAVWKAARGWASDTTTAARNFDFDWQGTATALIANQNTVGWATGGCSGGTLAFTQLPLQDGWHIVMCENWTWSDGPGNPAGGQIDIQGVATHELGHALGLDHADGTGPSCGFVCNTARPTMCAAICSNGVSERDIAADDQAGLQAIYGAIPGNKPRILSLTGSFTTGQTLTINGLNFGPTVNVKFTAGTTQNTGAIPGVVFGVSTTGTQLSVIIPSAAKKGNVLIWQPTDGLLSNAFPIDVVAGPPSPPVIVDVSPPDVQAFDPGVVTVSGSAFTGATQLSLGGSPVPFMVVNDNTITFSPAQPAVLGSQTVTVTTPLGTSNVDNLNFVETSPPQLTANAFAISGQPYTWNFGGPANDIWFLLYAGDPTTFPFSTYQILLNSDIVTLNTFPANGISSVQVTMPPGLGGVVLYTQIVTFDGVSDVQASGVLTTTFIL